MTLEEAVSISLSYRDVCRNMGVNEIGGSYRKVRNEIIDRELDTSHFEPFARRGPRPKIPLEHILVKDSTYPTNNLRKRLVSEGLKENICEICSQGDTWVGKPLTIQLDHINGDPQDHRLSNLRMLCPNCHTQTDTYCSKNIGRVKPKAGDGIGFETRRV